MQADDFTAKVWTIGLLVTWSISHGAQYVTLDSKIKSLSLAVLFFGEGNPIKCLHRMLKTPPSYFLSDCQHKKLFKLCFCLHGKLYKKLYKLHECE
jgi:hypothetical protein